METIVRKALKLVYKHPTPWTHKSNELSWIKGRFLVDGNGKAFARIEPGFAPDLSLEELADLIVEAVNTHGK